MGKLVEDAQAVADAAANLVAEIQAEENGTVTDKTVTKVTVCYSDGSSVDFSPAGETAPGVDTPAPVVTPVTDAPTPTPDTSDGAGEAPVSEVPAEVPEGATEVSPTVAGVVPQ